MYDTHYVTVILSCVLLEIFFHVTITDIIHRYEDVLHTSNMANSTCSLSLSFFFFFFFSFFTSSPGPSSSSSLDLCFFFFFFFSLSPSPSTKSSVKFFRICSYWTSTNSMHHVQYFDLQQ